MWCSAVNPQPFFLEEQEVTLKVIATNTTTKIIFFIGTINNKILFLDNGLGLNVRKKKYQHFIGQTYSFLRINEKKAKIFYETFKLLNFSSVYTISSSI